MDNINRNPLLTVPFLGPVAVIGTFFANRLILSIHDLFSVKGGGCLSNRSSTNCTIADLTLADEIEHVVELEGSVYSQAFDSCDECRVCGTVTTATLEKVVGS
jgi:hypothetical protein